MTQFAEIIENFDSMNFETQEILMDILNKRFEDRKNELFIADTLEAVKDQEAGNVKSGTSGELFEELGI